MTRRYTTRIYPFDAEGLIKSHTDTAVLMCHSAALLMFKTRLPEYPEFHASLNQQVAEALSKAVKLSDALKEKIVTAEYTPYCPSATHWNAFDPTSMEGTDSESVPPPRTPVMCTVRLGLLTSSKAGREREAPLQQLLFRKAQVITLHCLEDAQTACDNNM